MTTDLLLVYKIEKCDLPAKGFTQALKYPSISLLIEVDVRNNQTFWASFRLNKLFPKRAEMESLCFCFNDRDTVHESKHMVLRAVKRASSHSHFQQV